MRFFRNPEEFDSKESKSDVPQLSTNLTSNKKKKKKKTHSGGAQLNIQSDDDGF
jgi:hypothetical protein